MYILSLGWLVTAAGFAMVIPFMSIYFHQELNISMSAIGLFFGFGAILRAVPQPFAGWLSDRIGRVPIMGWSLVLRAITFAAVGYAIMSQAGFFTIAAIISFNYITGSVLHPAANAMVADLVRKEQRIAAFGLLRIAGNLGWAIGPALGGFIAHQSYSALFIIAGLISLFSGLFFLFALKDVTRSQANDTPEFKLSDILNLRQDKRLFEHCLISLALYLAIAQLIAALSVYSVETVGISRAELGALYMINGLLVVVLQFPISALFKRMALTRQLAFGAVVYAIGYLMVGVAPGFIFLILCMIIITFGEMIVSPPSMTLVANLSSPGKYGRYMGLFGFFQMAGWSLGPTVGGGLLDLFAEQPIIMWLIIALIAMIACVLYINLGRKLPPHVDSGLKSGTEDSANA
jgi:MFS family permease